jgi:hypothetical protein
LAEPGLMNVTDNLSRRPVTIIGVDPGKSCGMATLTDGRLSYVFQGPAPTMLDSLRTQVARAQGAVTVACERYVVYPKRYMHQPDTLEVIGAVKLICGDLGVDLVLQYARDAKKLASNDRLRDLGMFVGLDEVNTPDADDVRDAVRPALLRLALDHTAIYERLLSHSRSPA